MLLYLQSKHHNIEVVQSGNSKQRVCPPVGITEESLNMQLLPVLTGRAGLVSPGAITMLLVWLVGMSEGTGLRILTTESQWEWYAD